MKKVFNNCNDEPVAEIGSLSDLTSHLISPDRAVVRDSREPGSTSGRGSVLRQRGMSMLYSVEMEELPRPPTQARSSKKTDENGEVNFSNLSISLETTSLHVSRKTRPVKVVLTCPSDLHDFVQLQEGVSSKLSSGETSNVRLSNSPFLARPAIIYSLSGKELEVPVPLMLCEWTQWTEVNRLSLVTFFGSLPWEVVCPAVPIQFERFARMLYSVANFSVEDGGQLSFKSREIITWPNSGDELMSRPPASVLDTLLEWWQRLSSVARVEEFEACQNTFLLLKTVLFHYLGPLPTLVKFDSLLKKVKGWTAKMADSEARGFMRSGKDIMLTKGSFWDHYPHACTMFPRDYQDLLRDEVPALVARVDDWIIRRGTANNHVVSNDHQFISTFLHFLQFSKRGYRVSFILTNGGRMSDEPACIYPGVDHIASTAMTQEKSLVILDEAIEWDYVYRMITFLGFTHVSVARRWEDPAFRCSDLLPRVTYIKAHSWWSLRPDERMWWSFSLAKAPVPKPFSKDVLAELVRLALWRVTMNTRVQSALWLSATDPSPLTAMYTAPADTYLLAQCVFERMVQGALAE